MKKTRPFTFKIVAAEFFSAAQKIPVKDRGKFLIQFATDLVTLEPVTDYGKQVVGETLDFIKKQSEHGKNGGKPKHRQPKGRVKAAYREPQGSPYPKEGVKEEKKEYAEKVFMTDAQYVKLVEKHGAIKTTQAIEKLSVSKCANSKMKYDSDYHAILKWVIAAIEKDNPHQTMQQQLYN